MNSLIVGIGADHAGFAYKDRILKDLEAAGYKIVDVGTYNEDPADYPDIAVKMAEAMHSHQLDRGILICGSGVGISIAVNKFPGIRAALCHDSYSAHQGVEHDDMNVLCIGQRVVGIELAKELINTFLQARFSHEERHVRRLNKTLAIEVAQMKEKP